MNGRTENDLMIEKRIEHKLEGQDSILRDFYRWMNGKSVQTKDKYIYYVINFLDYCKEKMRIQEITSEIYKDIPLEVLNEYVQSSSVSKAKGNPGERNGSSIIATRMCAISTFFRFLKIKGLIEENICKYVDRPRVRDKDHIVFLEKNEIRELMSNIENGIGSDRSKEYQKRFKSRDKVICLLPLVTGMRISALRNINIEDIDFQNMTISVIEKENKHRVFQVPFSVCKEIKIWIRERDEIVKRAKCETSALFISLYNGECKRLSSQAINNLIKKYSSTIHKKITAHKLRDTFATNLYNETADIFLVSEMLGHENPQTTKKYVRASDEQRKGAVKIMADLIF